VTYRIARTADGDPLLGDEEGFVPLSAADPDLPDTAAALRAAPRGLPDPAAATADRIPADDIDFGLPFDPGKLWGIGLNYADHAADLDEQRPEAPASFLKPRTAVTGPGGPIRLPEPDRTDHVTAEAELGVVLGRTCTGVTDADADDVVAGLVPVIDMTAEDVLRRNPRFLTRAKSFDTFLVVGPWVAVPESGSAGALADLAGRTVRTVVDDEVRAENRIENMLFSPRELVAFHSDVMTLEPGDLISTGTPGAHPIEAGERARAEVEGVGTLSADVVR
jgi:2-keto-4-pentenoate hydratase/2-oxohepta-3-ene-1,7-dioic acid hydratase in catechol pathway